jgi:hypothetical protein
MPLRRTALPTGPDMLLYRRLEFGRLASLHVLDTRQYRTDQPLGPNIQPPSAALLDPKGTMLQVTSATGFRWKRAPELGMEHHRETVGRQDRPPDRPCHAP